jgi:NitT/TauT family transport system substrate-binding protein
VQKRLNYDKAYIDEVWPKYTFALSLDEALIVAMEDEARWMIAHNLTAEKSVPNFADYIREAGLKVVEPKAVTIVR